MRDARAARMAHIAKGDPELAAGTASLNNYSPDDDDDEDLAELDGMLARYAKAGPPAQPQNTIPAPPRNAWAQGTPHTPGLEFGRTKAQALGDRGPQPDPTPPRKEEMSDKTKADCNCHDKATDHADAIREDDYEESGGRITWEARARRDRATYDPDHRDAADPPRIDESDLEVSNSTTEFGAGLHMTWQARAKRDRALLEQGSNFRVGGRR